MGAGETHPAWLCAPIASAATLQIVLKRAVLDSTREIIPTRKTSAFFIPLFFFNKSLPRKSGETVPEKLCGIRRGEWYTGPSRCPPVTFETRRSCPEVAPIRPSRQSAGRRRDASRHVVEDRMQTTRVQAIARESASVTESNTQAHHSLGHQRTR